MSITTLSSRQFNQDASKAKKAAAEGPVFITDRGHPAHVLMTYDQYKKLTRTRSRISELLAMPGIADIELELPVRHDLPRAVDLD
ncbi:MAG TPA: type II toxin-antitoxin system prevent-host-death family antitoxin [Arenimonas sp.]|nr:type II toxin-antitoxin system prevent-host-death family antitoxin [Arenimonas sp.]